MMKPHVTFEAWGWLLHRWPGNPNAAYFWVTSKVLIYPVIETVEQKYPQGANIPWTAPHHKNFSSDLENSSGDRDSCDPDTCLLNLPQPHSNPSPFTHHAAFFTVEIIQLTGRPPYKYPIHTQRCLSPNRPLPLQIPHPYPALCLQTAQHDMPSTPPATCACTGPLGYKPAGKVGQRVTLCPSSLQREQRCTRSGIFSSAPL